MIDFSLSEEIDELYSICNKFSSKAFSINQDSSHYDKVWDSNIHNSYCNLGISSLLLRSDLGGDFNPGAVVAAFSALSAGDISGIIRHEISIPISPIINVLETKNTTHNLVVPSNIPAKQIGNPVFRVAFVKALNKDVDDSQIQKWLPGDVGEWNVDNKETMKSNLYVVGLDFMAVIGSDKIVASQVNCGGIQTAGGIRVEFSLKDANFHVPISLEEGLYIRTLIRLWISAMLLGLADAASEYGIKYGLERMVFDKPILGHQANAFAMSSAVTNLESCRLALYMGSSIIEESPRVEQQYGMWLVNQSYMKLCEVSPGIIDLTLQLLGGHGYMKDHPVERWWRESFDVTCLFGARASCHDDLLSFSNMSTDWLEWL